MYFIGKSVCFKNVFLLVNEKYPENSDLFLIFL